MPSFLLGQLLLFFLFFRLYMAGFELFPPGSYVAFSDSPFQWARFLALPWLSIALVTAATLLLRRDGPGGIVEPP